jgi:hypothetical protein
LGVGLLLVLLDALTPLLAKCKLDEGEGLFPTGDFSRRELIKPIDGVNAKMGQCK